MNILAVDDEQSALSLLNKALLKIMPNDNIACFLTVDDALSYAQNSLIDVAFLDIEMGNVSGLNLAKQLTEIKADTNIIFVTGYMQYMDEAFKMYASGYVKKPVRIERIKRELEHLRYPVKVNTHNIGAYSFDHTARRVYKNGVDVLLTPMEYNIFYILSCNPDIYFTAQELLERTTGQNPTEVSSAFYSHISHLRKKLGLDDGETKNPIDIEQIRGKGYKLVISKLTN